MMPKPRISVFVSSTRKDLSIYRDKVRDVLIKRGMHPIMMEDFPAISRDSVTVCEEYVARADLFIGVYAKRYGYCPNNGTKSITEMEYDWAKAHELDCLVFQLDSHYQLASNDDLVLEADNNPSIQTFMDSLEKKTVVKKFTTPDNLALEVLHALDEWQKFPLSREFRLPILLTVIMLFFLTSYIIGDLALHLVRANIGGTDFTLVVTALLIGLAFPFVVQLGLIRKAFRRIKLSSELGLIIVQVLALIGMMSIRQPLVDALGNKLLDEALISNSDTIAHQAIDSVRMLGVSTITEHLKNEIENSLASPAIKSIEQRLISLASLYRYAAGGPDELSRKIQRDLEVAAYTRKEETSRLAEILALLDPLAAQQISKRFNDAGVTAMAKNPSDIDAARVYLDAVAHIQDLLPDIRSPQEQSITYLNLGYLEEQIPEINSAQVSYQKALELDSNNFQADYALSSLLLINYSDNKAEMTQALQLATNGQKSVAPYCQNAQDLTDDTVFNKTWYCFLLLTTQAEARYFRNDTGLGDISSIIESLLRRAIALAEANDQFRSRSGYYTAEAYYYLSQIVTTDDSSLCNIIRYHNRDNARQRSWVKYANDHLKHDCSLG